MAQPSRSRHGSGAINVGTYYFFFGAFGAYFGLEDTLVVRVAFVAVITGLQALINHFGIGPDGEAHRLLGLPDLRDRNPADDRLPRCGPELRDRPVFSPSPTTPARKGQVVSGRTRSPPLMAFGLGLLLPIYTITGYDASAHTSEETIKASTSVPRA